MTDKNRQRLQELLKKAQEQRKLSHTELIEFQRLVVSRTSERGHDLAREEKVFLQEKDSNAAAI